MTYYDDEVDDGGYVGPVDPYEDYLEGRTIRVRFLVENGRTIGRILPRNPGGRPCATKIVFLDRTWIGPQPSHGQELLVCVARNTKPDDPARGALIVRRQRIDGCKNGGYCAKCPSCGKSNVRKDDPVTRKWVTFTTCPDCNDSFEIFRPR